MACKWEGRRCVGHFKCPQLSYGTVVRSHSCVDVWRKASRKESPFYTMTHVKAMTKRKDDDDGTDERKTPVFPVCLSLGDEWGREWRGNPDKRAIRRWPRGRRRPIHAQDLPRWQSFARLVPLHPSQIRPHGRGLSLCCCRIIPPLFFSFALPIFPSF